MNEFIETPRMDTHVSIGSGGGPRFKTFTFSGHSGVEVVDASWSTSRAKYLINETVRDMADFDAIRALFYVCRGKARGFRFKDWADFQATDENIGTGDGSTRVFNLRKTYGTGTHAYQRRIFKPVSGTVTTKVNGVTVASTVDTTTGIVTFSVPNTPANGHAVTASFEFDVPVRFNVDELSANYEDFELQTWDGVELVEIKLED